MFEGSSNKERSVPLAFIYDPMSDRASDINRYQCAYRIIVHFPAPIIYTSDN